jgi:hypothetical protein
MLTYFSWWYGEGLVKFWTAILVMTQKIFSFFSIKLLIRTIFDPWKRDAYTIENASLQDKLKLWLNNLISRFIGFVIRLFTIILGICATTLFFLVMILFFAAWFLLPIIILYLIINGVRTVLNA